MKKNITLIIISLLACMFTSEKAVGKDGAIAYFDINSPELRKVPVAVPYFMNKQQGTLDAMGGEMATLLAKALEFHGFISVPPPASYGGGHDTNWQTQGVDFAVLGQYTIAKDEVSIEVRLLNVIENQVVLAKRYRGTLKKKDAMILKFCDEIIYQLSGEQGVSLSQISFISDVSGFKEVYVTDVLGEHIRQVTRHKELTASPRFSPDASHLAYTSYHSGNSYLYVTDLSQSSTTVGISKRKGLNLAPAWMPDGKTMILTLSKDDNPDLYLMDIKGVVLKRLTANAGINVSPSLSPDGRRIAFVSDRSGTPQIYVMDLTTSQVNRITFSGTDNTEPNWSPKGDWIAYSGLTDGAYHIFLTRPDGGESYRLTKTWGSHESPSWSPDGRQIVFSRKRGDENKICAIFTNGNGLRTLFEVKGKQFSPQWSTRLDL